MKTKFNFKWLLLSFILSIASINTMWATDYLAGDFTNWETNKIAFSNGFAFATVSACFKDTVKRLSMI